jgi:hypothetical protein
LSIAHYLLAVYRYVEKASGPLKFKAKPTLI